MKEVSDEVDDDNDDDDNDANALRRSGFSVTALSQRQRLKARR